MEQLLDGRHIRQGDVSLCQEELDLFRHAHDLGGREHQAVLTVPAGSAVLVVGVSRVPDLREVLLQNLLKLVEFLLLLKELSAVLLVNQLELLGLAAEGLVESLDFAFELGAAVFEEFELFFEVDGLELRVGGATRLLGLVLETEDLEVKLLDPLLQPVDDHYVCFVDLLLVFQLVGNALHLFVFQSYLLLQSLVPTLVTVYHRHLQRTFFQLHLKILLFFLQNQMSLVQLAVLLLRHQQLLLQLFRLECLQLGLELTNLVNLLRKGSFKGFYFRRLGQIGVCLVLVEAALPQVDD